jgi:hypothetical protein
MLRGGGFHHDVDHLRVSQIGTVLLEGQTEHIDAANPISEWSNFPLRNPASLGFSYATSVMGIIMLGVFRKAQFI